MNQHPYEYSILRYIPNVFTQEFANIAIVMHLPESGDLKFHLDKRTARLSHFFLSAFDTPSYRNMRDLAEQQIRKAIKSLKPGRQLFEQNLESLLPQLLPHDPSSFQWSAPAAGLDDDLEQVFEELIGELLSPQEPAKRHRYEPEAMWREMERVIEEQELHVTSDVTVHAPRYDYTFRGAYQNGILQLLEPISFDYMDAKGIRELANIWTGRLTNLSSSSREFALTGIICGPQDPDLQQAFEDSVATLKECQWVRDLVPLEEFEPKVAPRIRREVEEATKAQTKKQRSRAS